MHRVPHDRLGRNIAGETCISRCPGMASRSLTVIEKYTSDGPDIEVAEPAGSQDARF